MIPLIIGTTAIKPTVFVVCMYGRHLQWQWNRKEEAAWVAWKGRTLADEWPNSFLTKSEQPGSWAKRGQWLGGGQRRWQIIKTGNSMQSTGQLEVGCVFLICFMPRPVITFLISCYHPVLCSPKDSSLQTLSQYTLAKIRNIKQVRLCSYIIKATYSRIYFPLIQYHPVRVRSARRNHVSLANHGVPSCITIVSGK